MKAIMTVLAMVAIGAIATASVAPQEGEVEFFAGIVLGVDASNRLLSVEEADLEAGKMTFYVPADAEVTKGDAAIELRAIRVGDPVSIEYQPGPKGPVAVTVKVLSSPET